MRTFIFLFCISVFGFTPKNGFSQNEKIRIDSNKKLTVIEVFDLISEQTSYNFIYIEELFENSPQLELKKGKVRTDKLLNRCLENTEFTYEFTNDQTIVLTKRIIGKNIILTPPITITGKVTDINGDGLPGVTVLEKGTNMGVAAGFTGEYKIDVKDENSVLIFSFVGFTSKEVVVGNRREINVVLEASILELNTVNIISTGYQKISKEKLTGSAVNIDNKYFSNSNKASLQEGLQGSVTGLQILSSNSHPQTKPQVIIRGVGSAFQEGVNVVGFGAPTVVLGNPATTTPGTPLYVIDGVPTFDGADLASINSNDIASITILKDASAASIYGARAANGVIVVETKSGKTGAARITYSSQIGVSEFTDLSKSLNTNEIQELYIEGLINKTGNGIDTETDALDFLLNPTGTLTPFNPNQNTNWGDELTRQSKIMQHNLSVSGGKGADRYYFSLGYLKNETGIKEVDFDRISLKLKYDTEISEKFNVSTNIGYSKTRSDNYETGTSYYSPFRNIYRIRPDLNIYNEDGTYDISYNSGVNPLGILTDEKRELKTNDFRGAVELKYEFIPDLSLETNISGNYKLNENYNNFPAHLGKGWNNRTRGGSFGIQKNTNIFSWNARTLLRYNAELDENQSLNTFVGIEQSAVDIKSTNVSVNNLPVGAETLDNGNTVDTYTERRESSISSLFLKADYSYQNKYLVDVSFRRDGSSRFGANNKYGNFYAVGLGWNIHNESFMEQVAAFDFLKLRTSYGVNGNDQLTPFGYSGTFSTTGSYDGENATTLASAGNALIGWEENATFDIGVDFALYNNRISGSLDYYNRKTSDLLFNLPVSSSNGDPYVYYNFGGMKNSGVEISLNTKNILSDDNGFSWDTWITFTTNKNKITNLKTDEIVYSNYIRTIGEDINTLNLYGYAGVDTDTGSELYYTDDTETETTEIIGEAVKYSQGKTTPDFYGSLTNTFSFKNFSLTAQLYTSWGGQIFETSGYLQHENGNAGIRDYSNTSRYVFDNRWQQPGDITDVPKYVYGNSRSQNTSTRWLHDASYIRLKKMEIAYNFSNEVLKKTFIDNLRIYASADNMWTYVKDKSLTNDPEIGGITGAASFNAPLAKTIYFGLTVSF